MCSNLDKKAFTILIYSTDIIILIISQHVVPCAEVVPLPCTGCYFTNLVFLFCLCRV